MKNLIFALIVLLAPAVTHAQTDSLEYPGGPTSQMTPEQIDKIKSWTDKANRALQRLENDVRMMSDELAIRDALYKRMKQIARDTGLKPGDLLLRQSLYVGVILVDDIEKQAQAKIKQGRGKVPGTVAKQSLILKKALKMAQDYYNSDVRYIDGVMQSRGEVYYNDKLVEFGLRIAKFVYDRSVDVEMVSATASYGILRRSLGWLNVKMVEDDRNAAFRSQIIELTERLEDFPPMETLEDADAALLLVGTSDKPGLRYVAKSMFEEVEQAHANIFAD